MATSKKQPPRKTAAKKPAARKAAKPAAKKNPRQGSSVGEHSPDKRKAARSIRAPATTNVTERLLAAKPTTDPDTMTPGMLAFAQEYLRSFNGTAAYLLTHPGTTPAAASVSAHRLLRNAKVRAYIEQHRERLAVDVDFSREDVIRELVALVRADPNELTQMRHVSCDSCWPEQDGTPPIWQEPNPECLHCQGDGIPRPWFADTRKLSPAARRLFSGVKTTKDGIQVLMRDQDGALDKLAKVFGAYELDNKQKQPALTEAFAQFLGQLHTSADTRIPIAPPKPRQKRSPA